jgi:gamma-glutamyl hydrolase
MASFISSVLLIVLLTFFTHSKILVHFHTNVIAAGDPTPPPANVRRIKMGIFAMGLSSYMKAEIVKQLNAQDGDNSHIQSILQRLTQYSENYVNFLEDVRVDVYPILMTESKKSIRRKMRHLDGVMLTGGAPGIQMEGRPSDFDEIRVSDISTKKYFKVVNSILKYAKRINDKGRPFIVYGICMGFESMILFESDYQIPLTIISKKNVSDKIYLTHNGKSFSKYLSILPTSEWLNSFENGRMFFFNEKGVAVTNFISTQSLINSYDLLAYYTVNVDGSQETFVGAIQHKHYPFFAVQFHPEKVLYETSSHFLIDKSNNSQNLAHLFQDYLGYMVKSFGVQGDFPEVGQEGFMRKDEFIVMSRIGFYRNINVFGSPDDLAVLQASNF